MAISAKRYCLFYLDEQGKPQIERVAQPDIDSDGNGDPDELLIEKRSEHGLGLYMNPLGDKCQCKHGHSDHGRNETGYMPCLLCECSQYERYDWMSEVWDYIINRYTLGLKVDQPEWFSWPAAMRLTLTSWETLHAFDKFNEDKSYGESVKPWKFAVSYSLAPVARMLNPNMRLVAPFYTDLSQWRDVPAYDIHADNPVRLRITTSSSEWTDGPLWSELVDDEVIQVQSYADMVRAYVNHPEAKYDDADGNPCTGTTRGRLYPTTVIAESYEHIGKTGHQRLSADTALVKNSGYYRQYANDAESRILDTTRLILNENYTRDALLLELRHRGIEAGRSTIGNFKKGVGKPQAPLSDALISIAKEIARKQLESAEFLVKSRITDGQIFSKWRLAKEGGWIKSPSKDVIGVLAHWD